jgi:hypothetical protein
MTPKKQLPGRRAYQGINSLVNALLAGFTLISLASGAHAQSAAQGAEVAQQAEPNERPAPDTDTFGRTQFVLDGDPIVPPRDYEKGIAPPEPQDYDPIESGRIYDVQFMGIKDRRMQFEVRGYSISDLQRPDTGQTLTFPLDQKRIQIRDLDIEIDEVTTGSLTYVVRVN